MNHFVILGLIGVVLVALYILEKRRKRKAELSKPFSDDWMKILDKNLPPYKKLSQSLKNQLHENIKAFIYDKNFEGAGGLEITDEIKVTIAAQASMLLLNRKTKVYPKLYSVVVYPHTYISGKKGVFGGDDERGSACLGESWGTGTVVLSWNSVKGGANNFRDGQNVTMHEFAHQLDQQDGVADGAPILEDRSAYSAWAKVFSKKYEDLQYKTKRGKKTVLSKYGATNPAEFFAVATETFFEKPRQMIKKHPKLYEELQSFYEVNPVEWI